MSAGQGRGRGRGRGGGQAPGNSTPYYQQPINFQPFGGWQEGHPPWQQNSQAAAGADPFAAGGASNQLQTGTQQYVSPYVNIADGDRVVEGVRDSWSVMQGIDAFAPRVHQSSTPLRAVTPIGPPPTEMPLGQIFENEAMDWRTGTPPSIQEQRGRTQPVAQFPYYGVDPSDLSLLQQNQYPERTPAMQRALDNRQNIQRTQQQQQRQGVYRYQNLDQPRYPKGPTYQQLYYPVPGGARGGTVWEQQALPRPAGPLTWKDTQAYGPGDEGGFDPQVIQKLETGDYTEFPNIEAIDEGPKRNDESAFEWRTRVVISRRALGIVDSELRRRLYAFPSSAKQAGDTTEQYKARVHARRMVKVRWERDKENHKNKMDHTHQSFDPAYATTYRAEKAARQFQNAKRRKNALLVARRIAERDNQPRPVTPDLPEDSSDEDLPAVGVRHRGTGPGPKPKRCLYCKHMRKPCTLVAGSPRPCDRCKQKGIVCEVGRDLEDPNRPARKVKGKENADSDDESDAEEEEEQPISAQEKASLLRRKRTTLPQQRRRRNPARNARRSSRSPEPVAIKACRPCIDQNRPCDGERPCGTCRLNGREDMCSPVSFFSKYRERDYREAGGSLQPADEGSDMDDVMGSIDVNDVNIEWDKLVNTPAEAEDAINSMDLGPMMNYSSAVIQDSIEAGNRNNFFQSSYHDDRLAMQMFQPTPNGPSFNRLGTVVEPDASYNSLAPTGPEFTGEPFADVAHYSAMTFGAQGRGFDEVAIALHNSVARPAYADDGIDGVLEAVERERAGLAVAVLRGDPDPDPALQGPILSQYKREWKQDLQGMLNNKHCDELIGIDICFKSPAKHCDYLQHAIEGGDWHTCATCHRDQNARVSDDQQNIIEYTKLYYCDQCASELRPRSRRPATNPGFRKEYCTCTSQMRKSWLCNKHRFEAMGDVYERALAVRNWMIRRGLARCNGCDTRDLGNRTAMWACCSCKEVVYS